MAGEESRARRPLTYLDGVGAGVAAVAVAAACWLGVRTAELAEMYASFGDVRLPAITRLVIHPAWRVSVPALLAVALVLLHGHRPHRYALVALAAVGGGVAIFWYSAAWAPIHELAGNIR